VLNLVPLASVAGRKAQLEIRDVGASQRRRLKQIREPSVDVGMANASQNTGVSEMRQRQASPRSENDLSASPSSALRISCARARAARRKASFTVALMVSVPSSARAAASRRSSMSTSLLLNLRQYILPVSLDICRVKPSLSALGALVGQSHAHDTKADAGAAQQWRRRPNRAEIARPKRETDVRRPVQTRRDRRLRCQQTGVARRPGCRFAAHHAASSESQGVRPGRRCRAPDRGS